MARETWVQSQIESYQRLKKWCLMLPCLTLSIIRRIKWKNLSKGVAPSPRPWCSCYWKGSLRVTLAYDRQLYFIYNQVYSKESAIRFQILGGNVSFISIWMLITNSCRIFFSTSALRENERKLIKTVQKLIMTLID